MSTYDPNNISRSKYETDMAFATSSAKAQQKLHDAEMAKIAEAQRNYEAREEMGRQSVESASLYNRINNYETILARPLGEIIAENAELSRMYTEQKALLLKWMQSQETFKALAGEYRIKSGVSLEESQTRLDEIRVDILKNWAETHK